MLALLAAGAAWMLTGLKALQWPADLPNGGLNLPLQIKVFLAAVVIARLVTTVLRIPAWVVVTLFAVACALASGHGAAIPALMVVSLSWAVTGRLVLRLLGLRRPPEGWQALLAGAGFFATLVEVLAARPWHQPWTWLIVLLLPVVVARRETSAVLAELREAFDAARRPLAQRAGWLDAAIAAVATIYVAVAYLPEIGYDALAMHLFAIHQLETRHAWSFDAQTYIWAVMPMLGDWVFAMPYMLGGETAARLANVGFLFGIAAMIRVLVLWAGGNERGTRWAVLVFLSTPLTFTEGSSLFIESVWAAFTVAAVASLARAYTESEEGARELLPCALFVGFALAAKAITLTLLPLLGLGLLLGGRSWLKRRALRLLGLGVLVVIVVGGIPYLKAWRVTDNPVFPFFNGVFRSPLFPPRNFESASLFGKGVSWDLPYRVVFHVERFLEATVGAGGFQWLLLIVPAVLALTFARRGRALALAAFGFAALVLAFQSVSYLRYVFPTFVLFAAVAGVALSPQEGLPRLVPQALMIGAFAAVVLNLLFFGSGSPYRDLALHTVFDRTARQQWLRERAPIREAVDTVNTLNIRRLPVALLAPPGAVSGVGGPLDADALTVNYWFNLKFTKAILDAANHPQALAGVLHASQVEYVILDGGWPRAGRDALNSITEPVSRHGGLAIRRLALRYRFNEELLKDPGFESAGAWSLPEGSRGTAGAMTVTVTAPSVQAVPVHPGRRYLNTIEIACDEPAPARIQINWVDAQGAFIKADIQVIECTNLPSTESMEVTAPQSAAQALVYASAHTARPVTFKRNSFRQ
ncbi:hypothetical protein RD110_04305 [Rhodoferax koreense]|uniref:Uncharacterized protein n=1 Tax=Rhodoferax koreensis TaxID=1842727 RepID=A0A1P8JRY6_9BURK|nr:hypothetical protein RD110_04305 [Rhodoferax koreense]